MSEKIRIVIRTFEDLLDLQVLRWKLKYGAENCFEPDEFSDNEIKPNDFFRQNEEISNESEKIILADDMVRMASYRKDGKSLYEKGYGEEHKKPEFQQRFIEEGDKHYAERLKIATDAMIKEYELPPNYEIVFEGKYRDMILSQFENK